MANRKTVTAPAATKTAVAANAKAAPLTSVTGQQALPCINGAVRTSVYTLPNAKAANGGYKQTPKANSIIAAVYAAVASANNAATGQAVVTAIMASNNGQGFTRPNGRQMPAGAVASTLRWLVAQGRLHVVAAVA